MTFDSLDDALAEVVRQLGGHKKIGPLIWPAKDPDAAGRLLADCFNPDRPARLSPEQVMFVLRLGRQGGVDVAMDWMLNQLHYAPTRPVSPRDVFAEVQGQLGQLLDAAGMLARRLEDMKDALKGEMAP